MNQYNIGDKIWLLPFGLLPSARVTIISVQHELGEFTGIYHPDDQVEGEPTQCAFDEFGIDASKGSWS